MRILLATDGSPQAERARTLLGTLRLQGSAIRVVGVLGATPSAAGLPDGLREGLVAAALEALRGEVEAFAAPLRASGAQVEAAALPGRPASGIVDEAEGWRADLLVLGSHGRGTLGTVVLGSVACEVVDVAPCPVLVARTERVDAIVFGDDGSRDARAVGDALAAWPIFAGRPVHVVSVAHVPRPIGSGIVAGVRAEALDAYRAAAVRSTEEHRRLAEASARRLSAAGLAADATVREGDPADELVEVARTVGAGLIAVGTRGRTGLERLVLGSVARRILLHAPVSVLVAHRR